MFATVYTDASSSRGTYIRILIVQAVTKVSVNSRHGQVQGLVVDVIPANHVRSAIYCVRFEGTIAPTITPNPNESWFEAKLVSRI